MFRKKLYIGVILFLFFFQIDFCINCPVGCELNKNNETCVCYSNETGWTPIYDFIITKNITFYNTSKATIIEYSFENPYNYYGNLTVCMYYKDSLIDKQIVMVTKKLEKSNFTLFDCLMDPRIKIILNCDKEIKEINYTNNVYELYNESLKCSDSWYLNGGDASVPENPFYVFIVFLIMLYLMHTRSNDKV